MQAQATRMFTFEAAHRLPGHDGKCRRLHGHHYVVEVTVSGGIQPHGPQRGMVLDFSRLDALLAPLFESWDHRTLLWTNDDLWHVLLEADPDSVVAMSDVPTAEFLAAFIGEYATTHVEGYPIFVTEVIVRETPKGWATWRAS